MQWHPCLSHHDNQNREGRLDSWPQHPSRKTVVVFFFWELKQYSLFLQACYDLFFCHPKHPKRVSNDPFWADLSKTKLIKVARIHKKCLGSRGKKIIIPNRPGAHRSLKGLFHCSRPENIGIPHGPEVFLVGTLTNFGAQEYQKRPCSYSMHLKSPLKLGQFAKNQKKTTKNLNFF